MAIASPRPAWVCNRTVCDRAQHAAAGQHGHPADDPWSSASPAIGAVTETRPDQLNGVMQRDQHSRQQRGQGVLDHHHPVQCGGDQHDHRTQRSLHHAETKYPGPAQRNLVHGGCRHGAIPFSANALTSMPATYKLTPVPLYQGARRADPPAVGASAAVAGPAERQRPRPDSRRPRQPGGRPHELRQRHDDARHLGRMFGAETHRQRADAPALVALDGFEIVQGHDAVRAQAVQRRDCNDPRRRRSSPGHDRRARDPGKSFVAHGARQVSHQPFCLS